MSVRITKAQADLTTKSEQWSAMPYGEWLRAMATRRRVIAAIYREASQQVDPDSIEWHAFIDAALMLEMHATANDNSAAEHDTLRADAS